MSSRIRIILVDDHAVLRAGLKALLNAEPDMEVVGEAGDGSASIRVATELQPDVILLDLNMPQMNGLDALASLRAVAPDSRILVLTMHDNQTYLRQVLVQGGTGFVLKQAADNVLLTAIRTVYNGGTFLHPSHTQLLLEKNQEDLTSSDQSDEQMDQLSDREREVLQLIALGHTNKEIAEMLYLSVKTVETYKTRVMTKLNLRTRSALVRFALQHGLLNEDSE